MKIYNKIIASNQVGAFGTVAGVTDQEYCDLLDTTVGDVQTLLEELIQLQQLCNTSMDDTMSLVGDRWHLDRLYEHLQFVDQNVRKGYNRISKTLY